MAERRKWDRPARELPVSGGELKAEDADPVLQKQRQYIKILEERNRLKKRLAETQQQRKKDKLQEREEAFITAFNVPPPASGAGGGGGAAAAAAANRKSKPSVAQLPSKMTAFDSEHAQCKSAPAIGLGYSNGSSDRLGAHKPRATARAKWSKPQGLMTLAAEVDREGKTQYCLAERQPGGTQGVRSDAKDEQEGEDEESYLEESFEEFDGDESDSGEAETSRMRRSRTGSLREQAKDIVIEEDIDDDDQTSAVDAASERNGKLSVPASEEKPRQTASIAEVAARDAPVSAHPFPSSSSALSDTTRDLLVMIGHLSRSKQRALMDVLHRFQSSQKRESDVRELRSSIGDPEVWRQLTATVFARDDSVSTNGGGTASTKTAGPTTASNLGAQVSAVDQILEEHRRWEEQYANEMRQRLAEEREAKEAVLREAEARRMAMLKQLEEEEQEIERLVEFKRRERLAKLRALEQQMDESEPRLSRSEEKPSARVGESVGAKHGAAEKKAAAKPKSESKERPADHELDVKASTSSSFDKTMRTDRHGRRGGDAEVDNDAKPSVSTPPIVPPLKLAAGVSSPVLSGSLLASENFDSQYEIRVKLVSTWTRTRAVGLTQISVYDSDGAEMEIDPSSLRLYDHLDGKPLPKSSDMVRGLQRLFNGIAHTNSEQDMWLGRLPDSGVLQIAFELNSPPAKLCIWNYNSKTCSACVRDVEVLVNRKCMWTGSLSESYGDENDNPCTWISVMGNSKKTARSTARQDIQGSSSVSTSASTIINKSKAQTAREELRQHEAATARDHDKPRDTNPLWLSDARASMAASPLTARELGTSGLRASASSKLLEPNLSMKAVRGSTSARRRPVAEQKELESGTRSRDWGSGIKMSGCDGSLLASDEQTPSTQKRRDVIASAKPTGHHAPHVAAVDALDILERFSKTNRSRLSAQPDSGVYDRSVSAKDCQPDSAASFIPGGATMKRLTSTLLEEFRSYGTYRSLLAEVSDPLSRAPSSVMLGSAPISQTRAAEPVEQVASLPAVEVPILPSGRWLRLEILSTWGDPYYVGLNGIEVFDHRGELISFRDPEKQITACPESVNVLEENHDDPRVPKNLVDGVNFTCDDYHMWLAPFTAGGEHYVVLEMNASVVISMVRIWNYNKSRAHTSRGVRVARLIISDQRSGGNSGSGSSVIFEGEISQAPGIVSSGSFDNSNEVILFTREPDILAAIEANDEVLRAFAREQEDDADDVRSAASLELERPKTSDKDGGSAKDDRFGKSFDGRNEDNDQPVGRDGRPMTSATARPPANNALRRCQDAWKPNEPQQRSPVLSKVLEGTEVGDESDDDAMNDERRLVRGQKLVIRLLTTWGDRNYIGLTQLDVLVGDKAVPFRLEMAHVDASPRDLASLGCHGDPRTIDKLIDGVGITCDDTHMWLVPLQQEVLVSIDLKTPQRLFGLRVWNYNKSVDDSVRGVKQFHAWLDGSRLSPLDTGFVMRKAPGTATFDYGQVIPFHCNEDEDAMYVARVRPPPSSRAYRTPTVRQDYEPPLFPQGFVLKLVIWCTWGDPYYVGLNGLELFDAAGRKITDPPRVIAALPSSVADIPGGDPSDSRIPANLLSERDKNTREAHNAWLAPLASSLRSDGGSSCYGNVVFMVFDAPITLSLVKFWNYAKTPERGVRDLDMYLDDLHVFSGTLRRAPDASTRGYSREMDDFSQPVLFTINQAVVDAEKRRVLYCGGEEQDVLCINEGQVMRESRAMYRKPDPGAEGVVVDLSLRPMTAMCRQ